MFDWQWHHHLVPLIRWLYMTIVIRLLMLLFRLQWSRYAASSLNIRRRRYRQNHVTLAGGTAAGGDSVDVVHSCERRGHRGRRRTAQRRLLRRHTCRSTTVSRRHWTRDDRRPRGAPGCCVLSGCASTRVAGDDAVARYGACGWVAATSRRWDIFKLFHCHCREQMSTWPCWVPLTRGAGWMHTIRDIHMSHVFVKYDTVRCELKQQPF